MISLILSLLLTNPNANLYPETAIVREIDPIEDTVLVECSNGNVFAFQGVEDWEEDDVCSMLMSDNGTENVEDDIILDVKYAGYVEE